MKEFKGDLAGFPPEIVERMLYYQVKQGNKRDISVFEECKSTGLWSGGFKWQDTEEGYLFWNEVIDNRNFAVFFERYPKKKLTKKDLENIAIHCKTILEAAKCCELADKLGWRWNTGDTYINNTYKWNGYYKNVCYDFYNGQHWPIDLYKEKNFTIKSAEWFLSNFGNVDEAPAQPLTLNDYQEMAMQTNDYRTDNFSYMFINLVGEVGEFASKIAKHIRKENCYIDNNQLITERGSNSISEEELIELKKEAGDILWLLTGLCKVMNWSLEDVAKTNLDKIADRAERGVIIGEGDNR